MDEILVYTIAEAAERLSTTHQQQITHRTLHYYESKFNLHINRDQAGNRIYTEKDLDLLDKIIDLKSKGMTLDGIKTMFEDKGILDPEETSSIIVLDEKAMEAKDIILNEIRRGIREEFKATHEKMEEITEQLEQVINDNEALRETIRTMQRQTEDHYKKVDQQLTAWRNKRPWYQNIFGKKDGDNE